MLNSKNPRKTGVVCVTINYPVGTSRREICKFTNKYIRPYTVGHIFGLAIHDVARKLNRWIEDTEEYPDKLTRKNFSEYFSRECHMVRVKVTSAGAKRIAHTCKKRFWDHRALTHVQLITAAEIAMLGPDGMKAFRWLDVNEGCTNCGDTGCLTLGGDCQNCGDNDESLGVNVQEIAKQIGKGTHESCREAKEKVREDVNVFYDDCD
jgi:hypothetical protein